MEPAAIVRIRETFGLSQKDLAKALNVAAYTVSRWESGSNNPSGLQEEVLRALYSTAVATSGNDVEAERIGGLIGLGIGALIFYLLTRSARAAKKNANP